MQPEVALHIFMRKLSEITEVFKFERIGGESQLKNGKGWIKSLENEGK